MATTPRAIPATAVDPTHLPIGPRVGVSAREALRVARELVLMTRPRILLLVAFTALPVALLPGVPRDPLTLTALLAALLGIGAACSAFNAFIERDSDALMTRTAARPLAAGTLAPAAVLWLGAACTALSLSLLALLGGLLAVGTGLATLVVYVVVYTWWLKPRSPQNIVIGGAAGAAAPLIADAALTGSISPLAWMLFAIVFLWTPPHFWAIAIHRRDEYAAASIPMLPVVAGSRHARRCGLAWAALLVPAFDNPGLWAAMLLFLAARGLVLALVYRRAGSGAGFVAPAPG